MRKAQVLYNDQLAGVLSKTGRRYRFIYDKNYLATPGARPVSITMPLHEAPYESEVLFPVFVNMLSEGYNKRMQSRLLKIDENDYFSLLLATAGSETIGPLTIKEIHASSEN